MECNFCDKILSSKSALNTHQQKAKYCLKIQGKENIKGKFLCEYCDKDFFTNNRHISHIAVCKLNNSFKQELDDTKMANQQLSNEIISLRTENEFLKLELEKSQESYKELSLTAVSRSFEEETIIDIDDTLSDSQFTVHDSDSDSDEVEDYQLTPLQVGQGFTIEHREEDGYINVTNLCKAGGKLFKNWKKTQKTKAFLQVLNNEVPFGTSLLIKKQKGYGSEQCTWVHPQVAINIAQWISPQFDVKVSGWVYEIMMTGTVDITSTKTYKELQKENKNHKIRIQYLTKKYMKAQPRVQYEEQYVVYILTTKRMKKDRVYILGKAINLTNRLSTYNKSDEHEVVYYQGCGDEETMSLVENMTFQYLKEYREQANRERFILPEKEEIKLFSDIINKSVEFFKK